MLHLQRGTPYIYQGEELGMTNVPFADIGDFRDIESLNHYAEAVQLRGAAPEAVLAALRVMSRDNARTPVQWSAGPNAGFTTGVPWIPVNPNFRRINAAVAARRPAVGVRALPRAHRLRHSERAISHGSFELVLREHPTVFAYLRTLPDRQVLVLANLSGTDAAYELPDAEDWEEAEPVLGNVDGRPPRVDGRLGPWEAQVFGR